MQTNYIQSSLETNDYFSVKTECSCFAHDLIIVIDKDDFNEPEMIFYDTVYIGEDLDTGHWWRTLWRRIKCAFKCLFSDGFEVEHGFIFKNREHVKQFQIYLNQRIEKILEDDDKTK